MIFGGRRALPQLVVDEHLVLARVVHASLACRHAQTRDDHGLHVHQVARGVRLSLRKAALPHAGGRSDDHLAGAGVERDDGPCGERWRGRGKEQTRSRA